SMGSQQARAEEQACPQLLPGLLDSRCEFLDQVVDASVLANQPRDVRGCVDDRRMVSTAEVVADLGERAVGELSAEVHGHVPGVDDRARSPLADELLE